MSRRAEIEAGLLERVDRMAKKMGVTRSGLVARGLEGVMERDWLHWD